MSSAECGHAPSGATDRNTCLPDRVTHPPTLRKDMSLFPHVSELWRSKRQVPRMPPKTIITQPHLKFDLKMLQGRPTKWSPSTLPKRTPPRRSNTLCVTAGGTLVYGAASTLEVWPSVRAQMRTWLLMCVVAHSTDHSDVRPWVVSLDRTRKSSLTASSRWLSPSEASRSPRCIGSTHHDRRSRRKVESLSVAVSTASSVVMVSTPFSSQPPGKKLAPAQVSIITRCGHSGDCSIWGTERGYPHPIVDVSLAVLVEPCILVPQCM